jgi:L-seryl-tRNA(Ser) seleniumtransferase
LELTLVPSVSRVGGGAFPEQDLATTLVGIKGSKWSADDLKNVLLATNPPLVGRIEDDWFCLDPRTLDARHMGLVLDSLQEALQRLEKDVPGNKEDG